MFMKTDEDILISLGIKSFRKEIDATSKDWLWQSPGAYWAPFLFLFYIIYKNKLMSDKIERGAVGST